MVHAVSPVLDQTLLEELILLGSERVLENTGIGELDFLIPFLSAHRFLALERAHLRQCDCHIRERHRES